MNKPQRTFLIMKLAALALMAAIFALLTYHSNLQNGFLANTVRSGIPDLGPESARPTVNNLSFSTEDGVERRFSDFQGQVLHVNFWAEWCEPCSRELPAIEELIRAAQANGGGYNVLLINLDTGEEALARAKKLWREKAPSALAVFTATEAWKENFHVEALPYHVMIDKQGRTAAAFYAGLDTRLDEFKKLLQDLREEKP